MRFARRWLLIVLVVHAAANAVRAVLAARQDQALAGIVELTMPRGYLSGFGALWCAVFGIAAWLVWTQRKAASRVTIGAAIAYQSALWLNLAAFSRSDDVMARLGFNVGWSAVTLVVICGLAALLSAERRARAITPAPTNLQTQHVESEDRKAP